MAAPHVTGAAALLFSSKPSATVTEVRESLLSEVDPVPSLSGKTVTGGRLDVAKAMDALEAIPQLTSTDPSSPAKETNPRIVGSAEAGSTVDIYAGASCKGAPVATGTAAQLSSPGISVSVPKSSTSTFSATATNVALHTSPCSAPLTYVENTPFEPEIVKGPPNEAEEKALKKLVNPAPAAGGPPPTPPRCVVPKLAGKTLGQATAALTAAHCTRGKVTKPKARKGHKLPSLVVKSSSPGTGATPASGKVDLTLGPKPKPKKPHH
jgi:hypothetical protein